MKLFYDELISTPGYPRAAARPLAAWLRSLSDEDMQSRKVDAELAIIDKGVTFTVYSDGENIDRAWPFDIIPRVLPLREWRNIEAGLKQRLQALLWRDLAVEVETDAILQEVANLDRIEITDLQFAARTRSIVVGVVVQDLPRLHLDIADPGILLHQGDGAREGPAVALGDRGGQRPGQLRLPVGIDEVEDAKIAVEELAAGASGASGCSVRKAW